MVGRRGLARRRGPVIEPRTWANVGLETRVVVHTRAPLGRPVVGFFSSTRRHLRVTLFSSRRGFDTVERPYEIVARYENRRQTAVRKLNARTRRNVINAPARDMFDNDLYTVRV